MKLKTRSVTFAAVALAVLLTVSLATGLLVWQIAKRPTSAHGVTVTDKPNVSSVSGVVTLRPAASSSPATAIEGAAASSAAMKDASRGASATGAAPIKYRVVPSPSAKPPVLPNEVNAVVGKTLGRKNGWQRLFYLEPLARRFVASVDALGSKTTPADLWLLKPAPGELKLVPSTKQPDTLLVKRANARRYMKFVQWFIHADNKQLLALYGRMYPLLQQTYTDLGHPDAYFNDRVIEVIDLMLATPAITPPLRVQQINAAAPPSGGTNADIHHPRYEFSDPRLESLAVGQKAMLRIGPQNAALLKQKLRALRSGLVKLGRVPQRG